MQCNRDCFNCLYPDCVVDELLPEDLNEIAQRDKEIRHDNKDNKRKKEAEYNHKYYVSHKKEILERQRKYRAEHRDEINQRKRKNYQRKKNKKPVSVGALYELNK